MARKKPRTDSFSDQLRRAVRDCGTTRYALAKQLGTSESTLSRFLSGERGLTLTLLDRLADVLGLRIIVTVQRADRPTRRGPKPKRRKAMQTTVSNWAALAENAARDAGEIYFPTRRGIWYFQDVDKLCVFNNNPYANHPDQRDRETAAFRDWLGANGIKELAYATYPQTGVDAGYTYAMILDAGNERKAEVAAEMGRIVAETWKRIESQSRLSDR
jgi:transcriptional regulator with XRE-family HTH domain